MDSSDIDLLANEAIPEAVRLAIAQSILAKDADQSAQVLEHEKIALERRKFIWNTPLVAAMAGLITLTATSFFERLSGRNDTLNAITLEDFRQELKESEARLQQQLKLEAEKSSADLEALSNERQFQYEIVKAELSNESKTNSDRAAILLFLVRAGVLNTLNRNELQAMAEEQIRNPDQDIVPQLTASSSYLGGIVGADDALPVASYPPNHPLRTLAASVGRLSVTSDRAQTTTCTAFLVDRSHIATAGHCVGAEAKSSSFVLGGNTIYPALSVYSVELNDRRTIDAGDQGSYIILKLANAVSELVEPIKISDQSSETPLRLGMIYYRAGAAEPLAVWGAQDCRVLKWEPLVLHHLCDTGAGASGAPVIDISTNSVVGIHFKRSELGGIAYRVYE